MIKQRPSRNLRKLIQTGFSMVEIMVAVAIAGILTTLGVMGVQQYLLKARQAEALKNLDVITGVYVAELGSDINSIPLPTSAPTGVADPGMPGSYTNDFNQPNFLGISLTEQPRYKYWFLHGLVTCTLEGTTSNFVILAIAESRRIGCTNEPSDFLLMGVTLTGEKRTIRMRDVTQEGCAETTSVLFTNVSLNSDCSAANEVVSINALPPPAATPTPPPPPPSPTPTPSTTTTATSTTSSTTTATTTTSTTTTASTGTVTSTGGECGASATGYYSSTGYYLCEAIDTSTTGSVTTTSSTTATTSGGTTATTTSSTTTATTSGGTTATTTSSTTVTTSGGTTATTTSSTTVTTSGGTTATTTSTTTATTSGGTTTTSTSSTTSSSGGESVLETCNCTEGAFLAAVTCYCCDDIANSIAYCGTTDDGCSDGYSGPRECTP